VVTGLKHQTEKRSMEHFAGLDVSVKETSVCIVDDTGRIVREAKVASEPDALLAVNEFYRVAFRKKVYRSIDELQTDLDLWIRDYNEQRPHQGRWCFGKTPMQTFLDAMPIAKEKMIAA
jgi:hypothetical protein